MNKAVLRNSVRQAIKGRTCKPKELFEVMCELCEDWYAAGRRDLEQESCDAILKALDER